MARTSSGQPTLTKPNQGHMPPPPQGPYGEKVFSWPQIAESRDRLPTLLGPCAPSSIPSLRAHEVTIHVFPSFPVKGKLFAQHLVALDASSQELKHPGGGRDLRVSGWWPQTGEGDGKETGRVASWTTGRAPTLHQDQAEPVALRRTEANAKPMKAKAF